MMLLILVAFAASLNPVQSMKSGTAMFEYHILPIILVHRGTRKFNEIDLTTSVVLGETDFLTALDPDQRFDDIKLVVFYFRNAFYKTFDVRKKECSVYLHLSLVYVKLLSDKVTDFKRWDVSSRANEGIPHTAVLKPLHMADVFDDTLKTPYKYFAYGNKFIRYWGRVILVSILYCENVPIPTEITTMHACFRAEDFQPQHKDIGGAIVDANGNVVAVIISVIEPNNYFWAQVLLDVRELLQEQIDSQEPLPGEDSQEPLPGEESVANMNSFSIAEKKSRKFCVFW